MNNIAILLTCYNRKEKTLRALEHLFAAAAKLPDRSIKVFLTDAASPDGTAAAVREKFPEVNIIAASSDTFWCGGMRMAWDAAAKNDEKFDAYLWLNDDTMLDENALEILLSDSASTGDKAIICGTVCDEKLPGKPVTYGGYIIGNGQVITPDGTLQHCDLINGNVVLVPGEVFDKIGNLDAAFSHGIGDFDYGLRAKEAGIPVFISSKIIGSCERDHGVPGYRCRSNSLAKRWHILHSPKGGKPKEFWLYNYRHFGIFAALKQAINLYLKTFFPDYE